MRLRTFAALAVCLAATGVHAAEKKAVIREANVSQADRAALGEYTSSAALWIWTDKVVYQPGEQLTVRWTTKPGNDFYPYTIVAFRQNNQTGVRTYLPGNSSTVADIFGKTQADGFNIVRVPEATKAVFGGGPVTVPSEPGMHTIVVQLRDYMGNRVIKSAYAKFGVVTGYEDLPAQISSDRRLTNDKAYRIRGIVSVRNNATLTIDPGTYIIGQPGSQPPSVLLITTAGKLVANGTRSRPIIMTSSQPVGQRQRGDWGGVILLGKAPVNDPGGELSIEGLPDLPETKYGGTDANHNCGTLRYVRVEFAGALLRPNEETNAITYGACGKGTVSEYLQAHYGLDDSFEWFGGTNDAKYLVGTYGADDYIDVQIGYRGRVQHVVVVANEDLSNRGVEADNYERDFGASPRTKLSLWNATFIGNAASAGAKGFDEADAPCLYYRRGAATSTNNVICYNWTTRTVGGANFDTITPLFGSGDFSLNGVIAFGNGREASPARGDNLQDQFVADFRPLATGGQAASGNVAFADPQLTRPIERSDPDFKVLASSPALGAQFLAPPDDGFFDQWATWAGGMGPINWTEEWTTFVQEQDLQP
ncbi:MAG TPA: hypothetical protein VER03_18945 [Bryobacteraceae bacterium]|nr:hypothetical protein [Bryobacteraceae bacterium]